MRSDSFLGLLCGLMLWSGCLCYYQKYFHVEGGPKYMYYFAKFSVGDPSKIQSAIIDTGSDTMAFPCDTCKSNDCGSHQNTRFETSKSRSFVHEKRCEMPVLFHKKHVCEFIKSYAEGSSLLGYLGEDQVRFVNALETEDQKIFNLNKGQKQDMTLKATFGCTTKETGLFKTQYADGILGIDNGSSLIESIEKDNSIDQKMVFSFGLCLHETGGIMSVDLRKEHGQDPKVEHMGKKLDEKEAIIVPYLAFDDYYEVPIKSFQIQDRIVKADINVMVDSGTTFSHFPSEILDSLLRALNSYCNIHKDLCGKLPKAEITEDTCLELRQPDKDYANIQELLDSFPSIKMNFAHVNKPYILRPKNYFYVEHSEDEKEKREGISRICIALKGQEEGKIILGAFGMIDYNFYFDRKDKNLVITPENCYVRTARRKLMLKRRKLKLVASRRKRALGARKNMIL